MKILKSLRHIVYEVFFDIFVAVASVNSIGSHAKGKTRGDNWPSW